MKVSCAACGRLFDAKLSTAKFCGATCRKRSSRSPGGRPVMPIAPAAPLSEPALVAETRRELEEAGKLDSVVGQQALRLAEKMCSGFDTGSATAAVSKEFRAVMALALADVTKKADSLDELAQRRAQKAAGA